MPVTTTAEDAYNARQRIKREAMNHTRYKKPTDHSPRGRRPAEGEQPLRERIPDNELPEPKERPVHSVHFVRSVHCDVVLHPLVQFDGSGYRSGGEFSVNQGELIKCVRFGPGYYVQSNFEEDNVMSTMAEPLVKVIFLDPYLYRDQRNVVVNQGKQTFYVLVPLHHLLSKALPAPELTPSLISGVTALIIKNQPLLSCVPESLIQSTVDFYLAQVHYAKYKNYGSTELNQKIMKNGCAIGDGSLGHISSLTTLGVTQHTGCMLKVYHESHDFEEYVYRRDFVITKCSFDYNNFPKFSEDHPDPRTFRTQMFAFRGSNQVQGHVFANTNKNFNHALKRLFGVRDREVELRQNALALGYALAKGLGGKYIGLEQRMRNGRLKSAITPAHDFIVKSMCQSFWDMGRSYVQRAFDALNSTKAWAYNSVFYAYTEVMASYISRKWVSEIPHAKRALRRRYVGGEYVHLDDYVLVDKIDLFLKTEEIAKAGKRGRIVASYGKGAIYAGELPEYAKVCLHGDSWYYRNGMTYVCRIISKPNEGYLEELGEMLKFAMSTPDFLFTASYGDDNVAAGMCGGTTFCFNTDISSNDSGQDTPAFLAVNRIISEFSPERADGLVEQCMKPFRARAPQGDGYFVAQFDGPVEGSGTSLTTALNCAGSKMGNLGFFYYLTEGVPPREAVVRGFAEVGHLITVDDDFSSVDYLSGFQFLKKSFYDTGNGVISYTNFGAIFRGLGSCDSDLDHIKLNVSPQAFNLMNNEDRMELFISNVVRGYKNEPSSSIMNALRKRFSNSNADVLTDYDIHVGGSKDHSGVTLPDEFIIARYGCASYELSEIVNAITELQLGDIISSSGIAKFLAKDYGY